MLYCIVLYCIVLYCIVLYCIVLYLYCVTFVFFDLTYPGLCNIGWCCLAWYHELPYFTQASRYCYKASYLLLSCYVPSRHTFFFNKIIICIETEFSRLLLIKIMTRGCFGDVSCCFCWFIYWILTSFFIIILFLHSYMNIFIWIIVLFYFLFTIALVIYHHWFLRCWKLYQVDRKFLSRNVLEHR